MGWGGGSLTILGILECPLQASSHLLNFTPPISLQHHSKQSSYTCIYLSHSPPSTTYLSKFLPYKSGTSQGWHVVDAQ